LFTEAIGVVRSAHQVLRKNKMYDSGGLSGKELNSCTGIKEWQYLKGE
jgi:hypothetical protein